MKSEEIFNKAKNLFPSGVNSPVRYYKPYPIYFSSANGSRLFDVDGNEYLDFNTGFGAIIAGYSNSEIVEETFSYISRSVPEGVPSELEVELGQIINKAAPSIEMMRFTNSGTEATMHAIRLARGYTNRKYILKMNGGYHGAHDYLLVNAGSGAENFGVPTSAGIPKEISNTVLVGEFNHEESISEIFKKFGNEIAAVITEPVFGNMGVIPPKPGFLKFLREICDQYGALLIMDEVITGFRFKFGIYSEMEGVIPDIITLGKIIGGGMPVGLFGGRAEIMKKISPEGNIYEAGTFSGNPYTMAYGISTLNFLRRKDYDYTFKLASWIEDKLGAYSDIGLKINRFYNMFTPFFNSTNITDYSTAASSDREKFMKFFRHCIRKGIFLSPGPFEASFIGFSHTPEEVESAIFKMAYVMEYDMNEDWIKEK
ncbi:aspartate aminotransferase family protein [Caldiplasma sukawensis]